MIRIKTMTPLTNDHGDVIRAITTENNDTGMTVQRFYNKVDVKGHTLFVARESAPKATIIRKPLFEVVDENGNTYEMTKRQAKKEFSARQVRKALKRMSASLKQNLRSERQAALDARRSDEEPQYFNLEAMTERMGIDLADLEGLEENPEAEVEEEEGEGFEVVEETDVEEDEDTDDDNDNEEDEEK